MKGRVALVTGASRKFRTDLTERNIQHRSELFGMPASKVHDMVLAGVPQRVVMEPEIVALTVFLVSPGSQRITARRSTSTATR